MKCTCAFVCLTGILRQNYRPKICVIHATPFVINTKVSVKFMLVVSVNFPEKLCEFKDAYVDYSNYSSVNSPNILCIINGELLKDRYRLVCKINRAALVHEMPEFLCKSYRKTFCIFNVVTL